MPPRKLLKGRSEPPPYGDEEGVIFHHFFLKFMFFSYYYFKKKNKIIRCQAKVTYCISGKNSGKFLNGRWMELLN